MDTKLTTIRALAVFIARKAIILATIVFWGLMVLLLIGIWLLAHYISPLWWIFAVPLALVALAFSIVRFILMRITYVIHRHPYSARQRQKMNAFLAKLIEVNDARSTSMPMLAFVTAKDLILHRNTKTLKAIVSNATSLKSDFNELEREFTKS